MRARRTDANHRAVAEAIRKLGYPVKSLHTQGGGVEDLLVGVNYDTNTFMGRAKAWVLVEVKRSRNKTNDGIWDSQYTPAQKAWYQATEGFPRLVVTSAQDAIEKLRRMVG
jgi:hypothetical protein